MEQQSSKTNSIILDVGCIWVTSGSRVDGYSMHAPKHVCVDQHGCHAVSFALYAMWSWKKEKKDTHHACKPWEHMTLLNWITMLFGTRHKQTELSWFSGSVPKVWSVFSLSLKCSRKSTHRTMTLPQTANDCRNSLWLETYEAHTLLCL